MVRSERAVLWWIAVAMTSIGVGATLAGAGWGPLTAVAGAVTLGNIACTMFPGKRMPVHVGLLGFAGGFLAVLGALAVGVDARTRIALVVVGLEMQVAAASTTRDPLVDRHSSLLVSVLGHATVLLGLSMMLLRRDPLDVATVLCAGFAVLLVHAFWRQRARGGPGEEWEALFLASVVLFVVAPVAARFAPLALQQAFVAVGLVAALMSLAVLALPPPAVGAAVARSPGATGRAAAHGVTFIVMVNALLLAHTLATHHVVRVVVAILFGWLLVCIMFEYRAILLARRRSHAPPPIEDIGPREVTMVVVAANEAAHLRATLERHLRLHEHLQFLVVPAAGSLDDTVLAAEQFARDHPDRVRVVLGTSGSKGGDLNLAWPKVETPYLVVMDTDETIEAPSLRRAVARMRAEEGVGIVQGRKVDFDWRDRWLTRFAATERRYSTWIDHPMQARDGGAHFAGSAAIMRVACIAEAGGWSEDTLTEDIDLTLRVYETTDWDVVYDPMVVVQEAHVHRLLDLVRQRTRWARGWAQLATRHLPIIVRERRRLGLMRTISLSWQLLTSLSGPWMVLLPLLALVRLLGLSTLLPIAIALPLALVILPARPIAYLYAAWTDPFTPAPRTLRSLAEVVLFAYLWLVVGWIIQLHAIYLELAEAPEEWIVTRKRPTRRGRAMPAG